MRKLFIAMLSVVMALVFTATFVSCDKDNGKGSNTDVKTGELVFEVKETEKESSDGEQTETESFAVITGYTISDEDAEKIANGDFSEIAKEYRELVIPATTIIDEVEYQVREIAEGAFTDQTILRTVSVEAVDGKYNLQKIGSGAFTGCVNIEEMTLPFVGESDGAVNEKKVFGYIFGGQEVSNGATNYTQSYNEGNSTSFYIPNALKKVTIDGQAVVPAYAFNSLTSIEQIVVNGATKIGNFAFNGCTGLKEFNLPEGVTSIGESAFAGCSSLITIEFPAGLETIYQNAFSGCSLLGYGRISMQTLKVTAKTIYASAFKNCTSLRSVEVDCDKVWAYTFYGCTSLEKVVLGSSVTEVQTGAFGGCDKLTKEAVEHSLPEDAFWSNWID